MSLKNTSALWNFYSSPVNVSEFKNMHLFLNIVYFFTRKSFICLWFFNCFVFLGTKNTPLFYSLIFTESFIWFCTLSRHAAQWNQFIHICADLYCSCCLRKNILFQGFPFKQLMERTQFVLLFSKTIFYRARLIQTLLIRIPLFWRKILLTNEFELTVSVVPRSTSNPLMDLTSVHDNNAWCIVD